MDKFNIFLDKFDIDIRLSIKMLRSGIKLAKS